MNAQNGPSQVDSGTPNSRRLQSEEFEGQFAFIDGLNSRKGAERAKTRSFVTKQHYRKRRFDKAQKRDDEGKQQQAPTKHVVASAVAGGRKDGLAWEDAQAVKLRQQDSDATLLERLGGGRADPFSSYPIPATRDVHELVDHYSFVIPSLVHKHWARAVRRPRSCWELFNLYRQDEIPFLGMLHHAAHHLARLRGLDSTLQSIEFKDRSLVAINASLRRKNAPCSDSTLVGIGLLANAERLWGDQEAAQMHWGALKRLLIERGSFPALKGNPTMHTKLVWSFIALSWPTDAGYPAYVSGFSDMIGLRPGISASDPRSALERSCDELTEFIERRKMQVLKCLPANPQQQNRLRAHRYRTTAFEDGAPIFTSLSEMDTGYESPDKRRAVDNCRMACLIYLNLVMMERGDLSKTTEDYLKALIQITDDSDDDSSLTAKHLLWTLLTPFEQRDEGHYERIWKSCRLIGVVKRSTPQTWLILEKALRVFLQIPQDIKVLADVLGNWKWKSSDFLKHIDSRPSSAVAGVLWRQSQVVTCSEYCQIYPRKPAIF